MMLLARIAIVVIIDDKSGERAVMGDGGKVAGHYEQDRGRGMR